ncbi:MULTISPECIES: HAD family hydrolase [unclassified Breznakia]|uniref:HAD family hydrolase n=1 Tax=unclassified Breznakia TaxID=2623764 RepID=UPI0024734142|nr:MULTISPECIES: HAD family hydrolase [unclassified Breznakia]MDH6365919.1 putative hydrolase of the HAD superfamily [Breznakia sp. PH1-1]MDH6403149.1 putative hydrolase of the HAD superfamily [Breznakia sp. PF1-11]MDH6410858.1 putative hydrolase of the HAD superfamily [Breznakia sp. PFB1-11]MDH6413085.1 putative hydrolase of the HAD superfamily [Breznakia sp. PFB1-14]MDH6415453.1 putative hydrolase of the HAD superfamily [Breznakia sp. PFB1-4]
MKIYFDLDDTLYDQIIPFQKASDEVFGEFEHIDMRSFYKEFKKYSDEIFADGQTGKIPLIETHVYRITNACKSYSIEITREQAIHFQEVYLSKQAEISLSQPMKQLLTELTKKNIELGIITNGPSDHQRMKISKLGLERWIDNNHIYISQEVGILKPNPAIFERIGSTADYLYIGDSYENDVESSKAAGWSCVWLNKKQGIATNVLPDYEVYNENELIQLVLSLL